ncbi:MAG: T9SS type A sorting domain-containing protein [Bacteroidia bacterium]|nr:T9SS type A sorting domain-containing protein [Bacteroidia bacterium]
MKTKTITTLLLLSATLLTAQTGQNKENQETKVRIKKIEKVNGVEKITDTTYVINGPVDVNALEDLKGNKLSVPPVPSVPEIIVVDREDDVTVTPNASTKPCKPGSNRIVIVTDEVHGDGFTEVKIDDELDEQMERALRSAGVDGERLMVDKVVTINSNDKGDGKKESKKIVIVKTVKMSDPSVEDQKMLEKQTGINDQKLKLDQMNFYPNPNTGKFNLAFDLQDKGDTEINVLNMEGRSVYHEKLKNFTGHYDHEIDISSQPKGVYFVKVAQGRHSYVKKMMIE